MTRASKTTKPRQRKQRKQRISRIPKSSMASKSNEYATCKELYSIKGMTSNNPYSDLEQNLAFYDRATNIAKAYQFFRIKYVKYTFIARYNVFQGNTNETTAFPMPQLYFRIDKSGALPTNTSIQQLKDMGSKPHKFTQNKVISWKPGVSITTGNDNNALSLNTGVKISPWLMTNKAPEQAGWATNDTDHKGLYWFMETAGLPGDGTYEYDAEVEVVFEFKRPLQQTDPEQPPATRVSTLVKKQTRPDGVVVNI